MNLGERVASWAGGVAAAITGRAVLPQNAASLTNLGFTTVGGRLFYGVPYSVPIYLQKFQEHPWLHAACVRVAEDFASLKWTVWRERDESPGPDGKVPRDLVRDHPLARLWKRPNGFMTGYNFRYLNQIYCEIAGESFILLDRSIAPSEMTIVPAQWVTQVPTPEQPWYQAWLPNGGRVNIPPENVIWIQIPNPLNPFGRGLGTARCVDDEINADDNAIKWNEAFWRNGAKPGGILMVPGLGTDQEKRIREAWEQQHQGVFNAFKVAFLSYTPGRDSNSGKPGFFDLSKSHKDLDFIEGRRQLRDIIIQAGFGIPPEKMGIVENSNRATAEEAEKIYQSNVLRPRATRMTEEWGAWLVPLFGDARLVLEPEDPVQESKRWQAEHAVVLWQGSVVTKNEARTANNLPPVPGPDGDRFFEPKNADIVGPGDRTSDPSKDRDFALEMVDRACEAAVRAVLGTGKIGENGTAHVAAVKGKS